MARKLKRLQKVSFTPSEWEVVELLSVPPYRTYKQVAALLTKLHPKHPVTEDAVKQRMSGAGDRYTRCKSYCNLYERFDRRRRRIRKGLPVAKEQS